ncbi:MAG: NAD(P)H-dependent oxidoreductase [Rhodothermales bacterium]|nr:NAD(P)H-dependent oxidoreductase [Rhodothermales bacterium]
MSRVLIVFAHPALEKSRVHSRLMRRVPVRPEVTFHDLYEEYPTFAVDVEREQALLSGHDVVVLQHPLFWYSTPPLLKQWIDLVLEHGWAYGSAGNALHGKRAVSVVTAGGRAGAYEPNGYNRFTIRQFLAPVEQTWRLCGLEYWPPYVIYGTHGMHPADIEKEADRYGGFLDLLADDRIEANRVSGRDDIRPLIMEMTNPGGLS